MGDTVFNIIGVIAKPVSVFCKTELTVACLSCFVLGAFLNIVHKPKATRNAKADIVVSVVSIDKTNSSATQSAVATEISSQSVLIRGVRADEEPEERSFCMWRITPLKLLCVLNLCLLLGILNPANAAPGDSVSASETLANTAASNTALPTTALPGTAVPPPNAATGGGAPLAPIQTKTQDFVLYPIDKTGQTPPRLLARLDFHFYEGEPSYRLFLGDAFKATPEGTLARYIEMLRQPKADVEKAIRLYEKDEFAKPTDRDEIRRSVERDQRNSRNMRDLKFHSRYDVGNYTMLFSEYLNTKGELVPLGVFFLHQSADGYHFTKKIGDAVNLIYLIGSYIYELGPNNDWNKAPRPAFKYAINVPSPFPQDPTDVHPLTVLFNGEPSHTKLNETWAPNEKVGQFFQHVVQTYRTGSREEWLGLWTPKAKEFWSSNDKATSDTYRAERQKLNSAQVEWVFTIDLDSSIVVFFTEAFSANIASPAAPNKANKVATPRKTAGQSTLNGQEPFIDHLVIWKDKNQYQLTQAETLRTGEQTFVGNLHSFFDSPAFQKALRSILEESANK